MCHYRQGPGATDARALAALIRTGLEKGLS